MENKNLKVIKIIDKHNILINTGKNDGVTNNSRFEIYSAGEDVIVDDINYGRLDNVKATLKVKVVYDKMALCQSDKTTQIRIPLVTSVFADKITEDVDPLPILNSDIDKDFSYISNKKIAVGDLVRKRF